MAANAEPNRPLASLEVAALPRGSPCGSIRARRSARVRIVELPPIACRNWGWGWSSLSPRASRLAARQPQRGDREEPVWQPRDRRLEWRLSTAVRCGQHGCPRADAGRTARHANQWGANRSPTIWRAAHALTPITPAHHPSAPGHADFIAQKSNVGPLSEKHVGQGGWLTLGVNSDMRRHGELAPKVCQPHTPQGSGCIASRGWF